MRPLGLLPLLLLSACGIQDVLDTGTSSSSTPSTPATDAGTDATTTSVQGAGCAVDTQSGAQLCRAVSTCPTLVVDSESFPHCGFRVRGSAVDLVCGCGESICSMGAYTTCSQASALLTSQTEQGVCAQIAEDRCSKPPTSSTSSSSSGGRPCDKQCLSQCGGGAACASVCGC